MEEEDHSASDSNMPLSWRNRRNYFFTPPLWYFHRALAGRDRHNTFHEVKTHIVQLEGVDWFIRENGAKHHTNGFELVEERRACIVRRGDVFGFAIRCKNRTFDLNRDRVALIFEFGKNPSVTKGTRAVAEMKQQRDFSPYRSASSGGWEALFDRRIGHRIEMLVRIPGNVPVGQWSVTVATWYGEKSMNESRHDMETFHATSNDPFYVLFNPFSETDSVYMSSHAGRNEFVLSEVGKVYAGTHNKIAGRPWVFGQHRDVVLPAVCHLLDHIAEPFLKPNERGDPVRVARALSAVVNSPDDKGVLQGRWDGHYKDGTKPTAWTGSVAILEEYMSKGGSTPVKYGQCWVFAGLLTTVCRALGIPCRCVTNYLSAHDTNRSLTVDKFVDENGEETSPGEEEHLFGNSIASGANNKDSIWNFHVWNEAWMSRDDLPDPSYGGWQVIDSTPQEESENRYQCGPSPVEAVKRGDVGVGFDSAFVFAEVNADVFVYVVDKKSEWGFKLAQTNTTHVGRIVITKSVGVLSDDQEDDYDIITDNYKSEEGTLAERKATIKALRQSGGLWSSNRFPASLNQDMFYQMTDLDKGIYGKPYNVSLFLHNQSREKRTVRMVMTTYSMFYTGNKAHMVKRGDGDFVMQPNERETLTMTVTPEEYMPKTVEHCQFSNRFLATVVETGQTWVSEDDFILEKPKLSIRILPETSPRVGRTCKILMSFINPLKDDLTGCYFTVEAPGLISSSKRRFRKILGDEKVEFEIEATPWRPGTTFVVASFNSNELYDITGTKKVSIVS